MKSLALFLLAAGILISGCTAKMLSYPRAYDSYERLLNSADLTVSDETSLSESDSHDDDHEPRSLESMNLENYDSWQACPNDMFMHLPGKCHPCAACGPDLYMRQVCTSKRDTVCDWCLNPNPLMNDDYRLKCVDVIQLQSEFNKLLETRYRSDVSALKRHAFFSSFSSSSESLDSDSISSAQLPMRISFIHPVYGEIVNNPPAVTDSDSADFFRFARLRSLLPNSTYYEMRFMLHVGFYVALIAFIYAICHILIKARSTHYRTVTVNPPILDEFENKNIIRAANGIRDKLGKKGYNRLEEFI